MLIGLAESSRLREAKLCTAVVVAWFVIVDLIGRITVVMGFCTVMDIQLVLGQ